MKKAVITTDSEWAWNVLGVTPLFVPSKDVARTTQAILYLQNAPEKRYEIADKVCRKVKSERSWIAIAVEHNKLYREIDKKTTHN